MRRLTLYSRPGCHLCEALEAELRPLLEGRPFVVDVVDIDGDPGLERRYGVRIPVLADGDVELSGYPLDRERVEQHIERG
ncbi:MAG TPA: glutaredoxin family protein [Gammaproteobacteria bacterium]